MSFSLGISTLEMLWLSIAWLFLFHPLLSYVDGGTSCKFTAVIQSLAGCWGWWCCSESPDYMLEGLGHFGREDFQIWSPLRPNVPSLSESALPEIQQGAPVPVKKLKNLYKHLAVPKQTPARWRRRQWSQWKYMKGKKVPSPYCFVHSSFHFFLIEKKNFASVLQV